MNISKWAHFEEAENKLNKVEEVTLSENCKF